MKSGLLRALGTVLLMSCGFSAAAHDITIKHAWVRAAPPNAPALGAFMVLENYGNSERSLVAARTSLEVERVELHRTMLVGDVMQMVPQEKIPLPAHKPTVLEPGSWHVMLIGPREVPKMGDKLKITLVFDDGFEQTVEADVRKGKMMMHKHEPGQERKKGMNQE